MHKVPLNFILIDQTTVRLEQFSTKIQYGFLPLSFDMQKKELVPLVFSPLNNIQSWPQNFSSFFSPKKQEKQLETLFRNNIFM